MLGQREVLLHLEKLARVDQVDRVLLRVDGSVLERQIDLGERERSWACAEGLESSDVARVGGGADLDSLEVVGPQDRALRVGDVAEADLPERQSLELVLLELSQELVADWTVHDAVNVLEAREQVRQVEHVELRHERAEERVPGEPHVEGAETQVLQDARIVAERAAGMHLDLNLAVRALLDGFGEKLRREVMRVARRQGVGHLQRGLRRARQGAAEPRRDGEACKENGALHGWLLPNSRFAATLVCSRLHGHGSP